MMLRSGGVAELDVEHMEETYLGRRAEEGP